MASIPIYREQETFTGEASRVKSLPGERIRAQNIRPLVDTKYKSIAKVGNAIGKDMYQTEANEQYNDAVSAVDKGVADISIEAQTEWVTYTTEQHMESFKGRWDSLSSSVMNSTTNMAAKKKLELYLTGKEIDTSTDVKGLAYKRQIDRYAAKSLVQKDEHFNAAINAKDEKEYMGHVNRILEINAGLYATGVMNKEQMEKNNLAIQDKLAVAKLKLYSAENPTDGYERFTSEKPGSIFESLNEKQQRDVIQDAQTKEDAYYGRIQREENRAEAKLTKQRRKTDYAMTKDWYDIAKLPEEQKAAAENTMIDSLMGHLDTRTMTIGRVNTLINAIKNPKEVKNDEATVGIIDDAIERKLPGTEDFINKAFDDGDINIRTYYNKINNLTSKKIQKGKSDINSYFKTEGMWDTPLKEKMSNAKRDAKKFYENRVAQGIDPVEASREAIDAFTDDELQKYKDGLKSDNPAHIKLKEKWGRELSSKRIQTIQELTDGKITEDRAREILDQAERQMNNNIKSLD